jgi:catechol 2,3-dioxygenase-like lactoylglutathione lyase family enzyme
MTTKGLNHVNLRASRQVLDRIRDFYCDVVGLQNGPRPPFPTFGYWLYAGGRPVLHLSEAGPNEVRQTDVATTFGHFAFDCEDGPAVEALLRERGLRYERQVVPASGELQLFVLDPGGNKVELNFRETAVAGGGATAASR